MSDEDLPKLGQPVNGTMEDYTDFAGRDGMSPDLSIPFKTGYIDPGLQQGPEKNVPMERTESSPVDMESPMDEGFTPPSDALPEHEDETERLDTATPEDLVDSALKTAGAAHESPEEEPPLLLHGVNLAGEAIVGGIQSAAKETRTDPDLNEIPGREKEDWEGDDKPTTELETNVSFQAVELAETPDSMGPTDKDPLSQLGETISEYGTNVQAKATDILRKFDEDMETKPESIDSKTEETRPFSGQFQEEIDKKSSEFFDAFKTSSEDVMTEIQSEASKWTTPTKTEEISQAQAEDLPPPPESVLDIDAKAADIFAEIDSLRAKTEKFADEAGDNLKSQLGKVDKEATDICQSESPTVEPFNSVSSAIQDSFQGAKQAIFSDKELGASENLTELESMGVEAEADASVPGSDVPDDINVSAPVAQLSSLDDLKNIAEDTVGNINFKEAEIKLTNAGEDVKAAVENMGEHLGEKRESLADSATTATDRISIGMESTREMAEEKVTETGKKLEILLGTTGPEAPGEPVQSPPEFPDPFQPQSLGHFETGNYNTTGDAIDGLVDDSVQLQPQFQQPPPDETRQVLAEKQEDFQSFTQNAMNNISAFQEEVGEKAGEVETKMSGFAQTFSERVEETLNPESDSNPEEGNTWKNQPEALRKEYNLISADGGQVAESTGNEAYKSLVETTASSLSHTIDEMEPKEGPHPEAEEKDQPETKPKSPPEIPPKPVFITTADKPTASRPGPPEIPPKPKSPPQTPSEEKAPPVPQTPVPREEEEEEEKEPPASSHADSVPLIDDGDEVGDQGTALPQDPSGQGRGQRFRQRMRQYCTLL